ncbi:MAG: hypothetical protein ACR2P7_04040 [bacterium]
MKTFIKNLTIANALLLAVAVFSSVAVTTAAHAKLGAENGCIDEYSYNKDDKKIWRVGNVCSHKVTLNWCYADSPLITESCNHGRKYKRQTTFRGYQRQGSSVFGDWRSFSSQAGGRTVSWWTCKEGETAIRISDSETNCFKPETEHESAAVTIRKLHKAGLGFTKYPRDRSVFFQWQKPSGDLEKYTLMVIPGTISGGNTLEKLCADKALHHQPITSTKTRHLMGGLDSNKPYTFALRAHLRDRPKECTVVFHVATTTK